MAFSAHNEMGQNERVDTVCCTAPTYQTINSESKFIPNPSAQPFVPKWNSTLSEQFNNYLPKDVGGEITGQVTLKNRTNAPDGYQSLDTMNGVNNANSPPAFPFKHIALHLLSKVLDDETIFSLEEGNSLGETTLPLTVDLTLRPGDVAGPWLSPSPHASPDCGTEPDPHAELSSSIPVENIWHNSDVNHNTSMTAPITAPGSMSRGWVTQSPISPLGMCLARGENGTSLVNGYENLPSPQMSSSVESLGNGNYYGSQYCSPALPDEWGHQSDSETSHCGEVNELGLFDYSRVSPVHPSIGLICLSGSWPQKGPTCNECSPSAKTEVDSQLKNGYCNSWKGSEFVDFQGRPLQYRRSISSKSDDDSWIGRGKESLVSPSHGRHVPNNELHVRLDQCYEQLRYLEKERHKAELDICKFWPARRISSGGNISAGRLHHSPSRVDKLLVDVQKEHGKVEALVGRIERIRHSPLNINISESVDEMMVSIRRLQSYRKDEINSLGGRNKHGTSPRSPDARDTVSLVTAVRELTLRTRCCRTAVWCASQLVLAEMTKQATVTPKLRSPSSNSEGGVDSSPVPGGVS